MQSLFLWRQKQCFFAKVAVIIVEDSKDKENGAKDIELAREYTKKGLKVHHYGLKEQYDLMLAIPADLRKSVSSIIGEPASENFYHKGQAVTRNLSHLKLLQLVNQKAASYRNNVLYYFVDSDQQCRVNRTNVPGSIKLSTRP